MCEAKGDGYFGQTHECMKRLAESVGSEVLCTLAFINDKGQLVYSLLTNPMDRALAIETMRALNTIERRGRYSIRYVVVKL